MRCSKCSFDNPGGMKFCGQCTTPLALVCPNCHFENPPGFKFCGQCTTALGSDSVNPLSSNLAITIRETDGSSVLDGERNDTPQHVAAQLGHSSVRMMFEVYGRWLKRPTSAA